jgi:hypothetical protein
VSDERARRIGLNEGVFRAVNERLEALAEQAGLADEKLDLICECGTTACASRLEMTRVAYEVLRANPITFAVVPGHERKDIEDVVEYGSGYNVVKKRDPAAVEIALETDPRG